MVSGSIRSSLQDVIGSRVERAEDVVLLDGREVLLESSPVSAVQDLQRSFSKPVDFV